MAGPDDGEVQEESLLSATLIGDPGGFLETPRRDQR